MLNGMLDRRANFWVNPSPLGQVHVYATKLPCLLVSFLCVFGVSRCAHMNVS